MQTQIKRNTGKQGEDFTNMDIVDAIIVMKKKNPKLPKQPDNIKKCEP